jgi:hypothetical protein
MPSKSRFSPSPRLGLIGVLFLLSVATLAAQANPLLDPKNWTAGVVIDKVMNANPTGVTQDNGGLRLGGFNLGKEAQYSLSSSNAAAFANKLITVTMNLTGDFVGTDYSFLSLVLRGSSPLTIFWSQPCYNINIKKTKVEVQKHGKGVNPNLIFNYADFPALKFKEFPIGQPVQVSFGVVKDAAFPRMVVKINGVVICNALDNKFGQTVKVMPNNVFMIDVVATNKDDGSGESKSNLYVTSIIAE